MKKILFTIITFAVLLTAGSVFAQTMTELVVPKYWVVNQLPHKYTRTTVVFALNLTVKPQTMCI